MMIDIMFLSEVLMNYILQIETKEEVYLVFSGVVNNMQEFCKILIEKESQYPNAKLTRYQILRSE